MAARVTSAASEPVTISTFFHDGLYMSKFDAFPLYAAVHSAAIAKESAFETDRHK